PVEAKQRLSDGALDLRTVGKNKTLGAAWPDAQAAQHRFRHDRVEGARVNQELHAGAALRPGGIGDVGLDVGEAHGSGSEVSLRCAWSSVNKTDWAGSAPRSPH